MIEAYLCCPAYPLADADAVARAVLSAQALCAGLEARLHLSPLLDRHPGIGAWLPAELRRDDLRRGLGHDLLIAGRGGFGCIELAPLPDSGSARILGFSDLTVLHALRWCQGGPHGVYGCMPGVAHGARARDSAVAALHGRPATHHQTDGALRPGHAAGRLFPACLRVLTGLCGTRWQPNLDGAMLAIEDIDERPYAVDRDLWQLWNSGMLNGITGLIGGCFPHQGPSGYAGPDHGAVLATWAERLRVPAAWRLPFGHDPDPIALPVGAVAELAVTQTAWDLGW